MEWELKCPFLFVLCGGRSMDGYAACFICNQQSLQNIPESLLNLATTVPILMYRKKNANYVLKSWASKNQGQWRAPFIPAGFVYFRFLNDD